MTRPTTRPTSRLRPPWAATVAVALCLPGLLAACEGGDGSPTPPTSSAVPQDTCVSTETDGVSVSATLPAGFRDGSATSTLDVAWGRAPADGEGNSDIVALDAVDDTDTDAVALQRMMNVAPVPSDGSPSFRAAQRRVVAEGLTEAEWIAPDRSATDGSEHRGYVRLLEVDGARFTLAVIASTAGFEELRATVVDSLAPRGCP